MEKAKIDRINELAHKAKTVGLTPEELEERRLLRQEYIAAVCGNLSSQLDHTYIQMPDGRRRKLTRRED